MKNIKYELNRFSIYDSAAMQSHLEKMAARGWIIRKIGPYFCRYERAAPQPLHFAVICLPKVSPYDPVPVPGQQLLEDYGQADGWKLEAQQDAMLIFSNDRPDPVPMETDPAVQADGLLRLARKRAVSGDLSAILLAVVQLALQLSALRRRPAEYLSSPAETGMLLLWVLLLLSGAFGLVRTLLWLHRARAAAAQGLLPPPAGGIGYRFSVAFNFAVLAAVLLLLWLAMGNAAPAVIVLTLGVVWLIGWFSRKMREDGYSRALNIVLTGSLSVCLVTASLVFLVFVLGRWNEDRGETFTTSSGYTFSVCHDKMPLYVQELEDLPDVSWSTRAEETHTPLLSRAEYDQRALSNDHDLPTFSYTVIWVKVPALYEPLKRWMVQSKQDGIRGGKVVFTNHYVSVNAAPWGAQDAYQLYWSEGLLNTYLLFFADTAVEITLPFSPTPAQMAIIGEKFET